MAAEWNRPLNERECERRENVGSRSNVTDRYSQCRLRGV